jgi:hypothetical protein
MNTQINIRLPKNIFLASKKYAKKHGFNNIQEFIRETVRERLFPERINKETANAITKFIQVCDEKGLWGTEEELMKELERGSKGLPL